MIRDLLIAVNWPNDVIHSSGLHTLDHWWIFSPIFGLQTDLEFGLARSRLDQDGVKFDFKQ